MGGKGHIVALQLLTSLSASQAVRQPGAYQPVAVHAMSSTQLTAASCSCWGVGWHIMQVKVCPDSIACVLQWNTAVLCLHFFAASAC